MRMESDYKLSGDKPSYFTRILTGLRTYTIGSCNYSFCHSGSTNSSEEDIELKALTIKLNVEDNMRVDQEEEEWKRRAGRADREMKKRLRYHFKSLVEKWTNEDKRRFPWKLILHVLLLVIVTIQVNELYLIKHGHVIFH